MPAQSRKVELHKDDHYSVLQPLTALHLDQETERYGKPVITRLQAGSTVEIEGPAPELGEMIAIISEGQSYAVFPQDLRERTTSIESNRP